MSDRGQSDLFAGSERLTLADAIELTIASLAAYAPDHPDWGIAYSGGKDSTATLTLIVHLIESGRIARPRSLTVYYADTRMELPPLAITAAEIMARLPARGVRAETVRAPLDKRFLVYILGRGVPPPNNNTLRWCTRQIKVEPMQRAIEAEMLARTEGMLMITGVRQGESAIRDRRIEMSCSKDGAECGQGWYQRDLPGHRIATLAPILHWRVCHVWDWLNFFAPAADHGGWPTRAVADAYGGDEAEEINSRTGCIGCPLASKEQALEAVLLNPGWAHLAPLRGLKPLYRELRQPENRLRKPGTETLKSGRIAANPQRMGPLTFAARRMALGRILAIQSEVNRAAGNRPMLDLLDAEEEARIRELIAAGTWPDKWSGDEPTADTPLDTIFPDGWIQPLLV